MLVAAAVILGLSMVLSVTIVRTPEALLRGAVRRRCLVSCKDGHDFSGVLSEADRGCLVLKNASIVTDGGSTPVDGEVLILRDDVAFIQLP